MKDKFGNEFLFRVEGYGSYVAVQRHLVVKVLGPPDTSTGYPTMWITRGSYENVPFRRKIEFEYPVNNDNCKLLYGHKVARTRYAHSTEAEAWERFRDRKRRQLSILSGQWQEVYDTVTAMGDDTDGTRISKNIRDWSKANPDAVGWFR